MALLCHNLTLKCQQNLGALTVQRNHAGNMKNYAFHRHLLSERLPDSPRIAALLELYQQMLVGENLLEEVSQTPLSTRGMYVGSESCKGCHASEYAIWKQSKHAHAYHTLVEVGHATDPECLTCHTVGFRFQTGFINLNQTPTLTDVGCENCHGVGGNHVKNPQRGYGQVTKADCLTCHTSENSPKFDYEVDLRKIRHWRDRERDKTAEGLWLVQICNGFDGRRRNWIL